MRHLIRPFVPPVQRGTTDEDCEGCRTTFLSQQERGLSDPAGGVVDSVVADQGVSDAVGAMCQRAGDDATALAAVLKPVGVGLGRGFGEPQSHAEIDQCSTQRHAAFAAD